MLVNLIDSSIYDINSEDSNQQVNQRATNEQPTSNHEQERIRKNKNEKEEHKKKILKEKVQFREFVSLTQTEHDQLVAGHGKDFVNSMLDTLNAYKGGSGKQYKDDYFTMTTGGWVFKQVSKDKANAKAPQGFTQSSPKPQFRGQKVLSINGDC